MIAYYYPPINSGGSIRPVKMAKYLRSCGHNVWVLTHSYGRLKYQDVQTIRILDISFNRHRVGLKKVVWLCLRLLGEGLNRLGIYHSIYSWWRRRVIARGDEIIKQAEPDLILVTYPPVETLEIGYRFSATYHIPLITDFRDGLLFESIEDKQIKRYHAVYKRYSRMEKQITDQSIALITINNAIADYFRRSYHGLKIEVIANGFDEGDYMGLAPFPGLREDQFNLVHAGRFGLSDNSIQAKPFFRAVLNLLDEEPELGRYLVIHLAGQLNSTEMRYIMPLVERGAVKYYGLLDRQDSLALQLGADLLLIITNPRRISAVSAKIFEYLYTRKPILALTGKTAVAKIIKETGTGTIVDPFDEQAIKEVLKKFLESPGKEKQIHPMEEIIARYATNRQMALLQKIIRDVEGGAL